jgi:hypothetical protein
VLLFEWLLRQDGAIVCGREGLQIDVEACVTGLRHLAAAIEELEREPDDEAFVRRSTDFLRTLVPAGREGRRFELPQAFAALTDMRPTDGPPLEFHDLPF